ncbi:helix-turn-helix domain-containing protein [Ruegeria sp. HKCCD8929]|uniref:helix-turn-helix domain-containing protein n=1 Tax=Ruegeria sp. HKCCD8929 TaxID=2683006 RepID=UPI001489BFDD|nr:helix-turn-helix domain-containing protein [Ruegeria sp. HKCCD8929]
MTSTRIRTYNLFGETAELADVIHCETIAARSRLHNWELRSHRHARLHQVLALTGGGGSAQIDGRHEPLITPCLINIPQGCVHGFTFAPDTEGWVITLPSDLVDEALHAGEGVRPPFDRAAVLPLPDDLHILAARIHAEHGQHHFARAHVLRALAGALIGLTARALQDHAPQPATDTPLLRRFEALVEQQFRTRQPLSAYAAQLAVTPTHLTRVVRQATGRPASALLTDRTLREARRLLIYTNLTAAQIAHELGYEDPAHFSRVFTKGTGQPPGRFRRRIEQNATSRP